MHDNIIYDVVVQEGQQAIVVINNAQWDHGKLVMVQTRFLQDKSLTLDFFKCFGSQEEGWQLVRMDQNMWKQISACKPSKHLKQTSVKSGRPPES